MAELPVESRQIIWLSCALAFVGGYGDAASFVLAKTFTGHLTGNFVLTAISLANQDWPNLSRRLLAIALFLAGILLSVTLEQWLVKRPARSLLPVVLALEITLILAAFFALAAPLAAGLELFVIFMALALGLQNGAWRGAGGLTVHSTYVTGMVTNLMALGAKRYLTQAARETRTDPRASLLLSIWLAFVSGALLGAVLVLYFSFRGILGMAAVLLALLAMLIISGRTKPPL